MCLWEGDRSLSAQVRAMLLVWEDRMAGKKQETRSKEMNSQEGGREGKAKAE